MSNLNEYLKQKREAVLIRHARDPLTIEPARLKAHVSAEGRSGVRRIRIRDHQVLSDSPADYAGYDLGPSSPELLLGCLGSCLTHIFLIKAAEAQLPLDALDVDIEGDLDPRGGKPGYETLPFYPHNIRYTAHLVSPASEAEVKVVHEAVQAWCPILNLLKQGQPVHATLRHTQSAPH
ncbi:OsmC family protein [Bordetella avium]|uniref:OsmC family protein n=1 Tax=Bordetella avium TaxID=521 RepID=UPI000E69A823|nr:OsmC family protein [Bordetella avium]AZY53153.1 osmotically inducible protein OsmC [Bordetella avium]RIQ17594.1 OsmC family peroxiredoxin [Bordetella avium]RIQ32251.1 OsmC family peroxiredoxin [Bordetella avium]RIQ67769.1 OsmC family peroxiredoxin [Bordetella avium]